MRWPALDPAASSRPNRAQDLYAPARWREPPTPVEDVEKSAGYHPRRSHGHDPRQARAVPFYYCTSCNRRVPNANTPFCAKHRRARQRFMRRLAASRVHVPKVLIDRLAEAQAAARAGSEAYQEAPQRSSEATYALARLERALADIATVVEQIARIPPTVRLDDIRDSDHTIN